MRNDQRVALVIAIALAATTLVLATNHVNRAGTDCGTAFNNTARTSGITDDQIIESAFAKVACDDALGERRRIVFILGAISVALACAAVIRRREEARPPEGTGTDRESSSG